jgi:hypothetical protein
MELGDRKRVLSVRFKVVQNTGLKHCSTRKQAVKNQYAIPVFLILWFKKP